MIAVNESIVDVLTDVLWSREAFALGLTPPPRFLLLMRVRVCEMCICGAATRKRIVRITDHSGSAWASAWLGSWLSAHC